MDLLAGLIGGSLLGGGLCDSLLGLDGGDTDNNLLGFLRTTLGGQGEGRGIALEW